MSSVSPYLQREMSRLKAESEALRLEVQSLRRVTRLVDSLLAVFDEQDSGQSGLLPLFDGILSVAIEAVQAEDGSLFIHDEENDQLVAVMVHGRVAPQLTGRCLPLNEGIAGWVVRTSEPALMNAPYTDNRFYAEFDRMFNYRTRSILAVPITGGGRVIGVIELLNKQNGLLFDEADQSLVELLCRLVGHALNMMIQLDTSGAAGPTTCDD